MAAISMTSSVLERHSPIPASLFKLDLSCSSRQDFDWSIDLTNSPLSPSITPSLFHSQFKTYLFHKSFPPSVLSLSPGLTQRTLAAHRFLAYPVLFWFCAVARLSWFPRAFDHTFISRYYLLTCVCVRVCWCR